MLPAPVPYTPEENLAAFREMCAKEEGGSLISLAAAEGGEAKPLTPEDMVARGMTLYHYPGTPKPTEEMTNFRNRLRRLYRTTYRYFDPEHGKVTHIRLGEKNFDAVVIARRSDFQVAHLTHAPDEARFYGATLVCDGNLPPLGVAFDDQEGEIFRFVDDGTTATWMEGAEHAPALAALVSRGKYKAISSILIFNAGR